MSAPKSETIAAIMKLNPTAKMDFLAGFSNNELDRYLSRLSDDGGRPRGHGALEHRGDASQPRMRHAS